MKTPSFNKFINGFGLAMLVLLCLAAIPGPNFPPFIRTNAPSMTNSSQTRAILEVSTGGGGGTNAATTVLTFADPLVTDLTTPEGCITNGIRKFRTTATANFTLQNPSGTFKDGQQVTWEIIQDGTGSRIVTMDSKFAFGTDITGITLSTTASKRDFITAIYNATADKWYVVGFTRGY